MFCHHCGRLNETKCGCLKSKPVSKEEATFMLVGFQLLTGTVSFIVFYRYQLEFMSGVPYLSLTIFTYLVLLSILTASFDKSYLALFFGCHQASNRSIQINGKALNICSRCTGLFAGLLIPALLFFIEIPFVAILLLGVPLIVDGLLQQFSSYQSNQTKRLISGMLFSSVLAVIVTGFNYLILTWVSQII